MLSVSVNGLRHDYVARSGSRTRALAELTFEVPAGQFVAIVGPSGCGKSTLLRLLAGLLEPTAGCIRVNDLAPHSQLRKRKIGFVFQDPALLPWRTTLTNVELPLEIAGESGGVEARTALQSVGLDDFADVYPHQLSGGMRSRAALARALVLRPSLLLLDEPFGALDELTAEDMAIQVLNVWTKHQFTAIMVTHSLSHAVLMADRVIVLSARPARVIGDIPVALSRPRSIDVMDSPYYHHAVSAIRKLLGNHVTSVAPPRVLEVSR